MKENTLISIWQKVGTSGLLIIIVAIFLAYMNLRTSDPILPGWREYSPELFTELMQQDTPVLVEIYAPWCPTCLLQHEAFETLHEEGRAPKIHALRVDFDRDTAFREQYNISATGMLLIFQKGQIKTHAPGLVTSSKIKAFLDSNI